MKALLIAFFAVLSFTQLAYSQDLLVTEAGDSIKCVITDEDAEYVTFEYGAGSARRSVLLSRKEVKEVVYDYYGRTPNRNASKPQPTLGKLRLAFEGAWSYRLSPIGDVSGDLRDYLQELKSGYSYGGSIHYFIEEEFSIGFMVNIYRSRNSILGVFTDELGNQFTAPVSDDITISHIAPAVGGRMHFNNGSGSFFYAFSLGYCKYVNEGEFVTPIRLEGEALSMGLEGSADFFLSDHVALGLGIRFLTAAISNFEVTQGGATRDMELDEPEGLLRMDLHGGVRFVF